MKRWIALLLPVFLLLAGCAAPAETAVPDGPLAPVPEPPPPGELRLLYDAEPDSLNYLATEDEGTLRLAANTVGTLLEFDARGSLRPGLAESWKCDEDARTWTLTLREDAVWVDGDGRAAAPVTASDFVAAARYILEAENDSPAAAALFGVLLNAEEYYNGPDGDSEAEPIDFSAVGVRAQDERTLVYTLEKEVPDFLSRLTDRPYLPVCAAQLEKGGFGAAENLPWSCGAYYLAGCEPQAETLLRKNSRYHGADNVFVETVRFLFDPDAAVTAPLLAAEGRIGYAPLDDETAAAWLADGERCAYVSRERPNPRRSYFYCFNFNVRTLNTDYTREGMTGWSLVEEYEPENWEKAVNNEAFRQSIRHALDDLAASVTPPGFAADAEGLDYTAQEALSALGDPFDPALAREYRDRAVAELEGQGAHFPVKMLLRPPADDEHALARAGALEERLETLLGTDYIDVIVEAAASENYWTLVRRGSGYMLLECFWDADSFDPDTWTKPFYQPLEPDGSYGRGYRYAYLAYAVTDGTSSAETVREYFALVEAARAQTDPAARLSAFAAAEAHLIDHALALPLGTGERGYAVSRLDMTGCPAMGLARWSFRGARLREQPLTMAESLSGAMPAVTPAPDPAKKPGGDTLTNEYRK